MGSAFIPGRAAAPAEVTDRLNFTATNLRDRTANQEAEASPQPREPLPEPTDTMPRWMQRTSLVVFVVFCIELGMLLVVLPWTGVWSENSLLAASPGLKAFVTNGFVRGAVSGLGLVNIWIGIWEAVQYRESRKK